MTLFTCGHVVHKNVCSQAETHFAFERSIEAANSPILFWNLLETAKNAPFRIKSPVKNFHGRAKGGIAPCSPLNTPLNSNRCFNRSLFFTLLFRIAFGYACICHLFLRIPDLLPLATKLKQRTAWTIGKFYINIRNLFFVFSLIFKPWSSQGLG